MRAALQLLGKQFGRLTVISIAGKNKNGAVLWNCSCVCGNSCIKRATTLGRSTNSCGCLRQEISKQRATKHGMADTTEWQSYRDAKSRCENKKNKDYPDYGGRGIKFLFKNFSDFFAELNFKPKPHYLWSVDRKNVNGNYEVGNVRWATMSEQQKNKRD